MSDVQPEQTSTEATQAPAEQTPAEPLPVQTTTPQPSVKDEKGGRVFDKERLCASVLKGEQCWALSKGEHCPYSHKVPSTHTRVYVCHLPLNITVEEINKLFAQYGKIAETKILMDPNAGVSRGVAFVHFEKHEDAQAAISAINGTKLPDHDLAIEARFARLTKPGGRRGGGGGRGGGGRGGGRGRGYRGPRGGPPPYDDDYADYPPRRGRGGRGRGRGGGRGAARGGGRGGYGRTPERRSDGRYRPYEGRRRYEREDYGEYDDQYDDYGYEEDYDEGYGGGYQNGGREAYPRTDYPPPRPGYEARGRGGPGGADRGYDRGYSDRGYVTTTPATTTYSGGVGGNGNGGSNGGGYYDRSGGGGGYRSTAAAPPAPYTAPPATTGGYGAEKRTQYARPAPYQPYQQY